MSKNEKEERLDCANALIRIIASHGRRFFWYGGTSVWDKATKTTSFVHADRYARLELRNGRVFFIDDYTEKAIYTHKAGFGNLWKGFSHGGTLRSLVEDMRDYVINGTQIPRWKIVIQQLGSDGFEGNIWGYDAAGAEAVRAAAYALPIIAGLKQKKGCTFNCSAHGEHITIKLVTESGGEPKEGDCYQVQFCNTKTGELLESTEGFGFVFGPASISAAEDLADEYMKSTAAEWEAYIAQSGRW